MTHGVIRRVAIAAKKERETHCILHLTSFSMGMGYDPTCVRRWGSVSKIVRCAWKERQRAFSIRFALNTFCITLKWAINLYSCLAIHFDARHWHIHCEPKETSVERSWEKCWEKPIETDGRTIDGVEDLAVGHIGPALLDPGIVDLEQLIEPCKKFGT